MSLDLTSFKMLIDGELVEGEGELMQVHNPATGELIAEYRGASYEQCERALQAAKRAFKTWSFTSLNERAEWMNKLSEACAAKYDDLIDLLAAETGKAYRDNFNDLGRCWDYFNYYRDEVKRVYDNGIHDYNDHRDCHYTVERRPIGVVVSSLAWNVPMINLGMKLGPIMATGNTGVLKASPKAPLTTLKIIETAVEIGLPAGVINIVAGPNDIAEYLNESEIPSLVTCIGSVPTGLKVQQQACKNNLKRVGLELGGNAPCILFPDANMEEAVNFIATRKILQTGQSCGCVNRIFVHKDIHDEFVEKLVAKVKTFHCGWSKEDPNTVGSLIDKNSRDRLIAIAKEAEAQGAKILTGGKAPQLEGKLANGAFLEPTVLDGVTDDMRAAKEELFGPVYSILTWEDLDDVIERSNSTPFGLASYAFTDSAKMAITLFERLEFGRVCINNAPIAGANMPHTGLKQSGLGTTFGKESLEEYYSTKLCSIRAV